MKDWKNDLKNVENWTTAIVGKNAHVTDDTPSPVIHKSMPVTQQEINNINLADKVNYLLTKIRNERQVPLKQRNNANIRELELELKTTQEKLNRLIAKLMLHYPNLAYSQISENLSSLTNEVNDEIQAKKQRAIHELAILKAEERQRLEREKQRSREDDERRREDDERRHEEEERRYIEKAKRREIAKTMIRNHSITWCTNCMDGVQAVTCPICNGTNEGAPRAVTEKRVFTCMNMSPNCPHCGGTGTGVSEYSFETTECSNCVNGMVMKDCPVCKGTSLMSKDDASFPKEEFLYFQTWSGDALLVAEIKNVLREGKQSSYGHTTEGATGTETDSP